MNSLEFIENQIQLYLQEINLNDIDFEKGKIDKTFYKCRDNFLKESLQTLHQIKSELEAWYVVKNKIYYDPSKAYIDLSLIYLDCSKDKNYQKLKKALEVEDE